MKHLNLVFDDNEHAEIKAKKDASGLSWERYILKLIRGDKFQVVPSMGVDRNE